MFPIGNRQRKRGGDDEQKTWIDQRTPLRRGSRGRGPGRDGRRRRGGVADGRRAVGTRRTGRSGWPTIHPRYARRRRDRRRGVSRRRAPDLPAGVRRHRPRLSRRGDARVVVPAVRRSPHRRPQAWREPHCVPCHGRRVRGDHPVRRRRDRGADHGRIAHRASVHGHPVPAVDASPVRGVGDVVLRDDGNDGPARSWRQLADHAHDPDQLRRSFAVAKGLRSREVTR